MHNWQDGKYLWEVLGCSREQAINIAMTRKEPSILATALKKTFGLDFCSKCNKDTLSSQERNCLNAFLQKHYKRNSSIYEGMNLGDIMNIDLDIVQNYLYKCPSRRMQAIFGENYDGVLNIEGMSNIDYEKLMSNITRIKNNILNGYIPPRKYFGSYLWEILGITEQELESIYFNKNTKVYQKLTEAFGEDLKKPYQGESDYELIKTISYLNHKSKNNVLGVSKLHFEGRILEDVFGMPRDIFFLYFPPQEDLKEYQLLKLAFGDDLNSPCHMSDLPKNIRHNISAVITNFLKKINLFKNKLIFTETNYINDFIVEETPSIYNTDIINSLVMKIPNEERVIISYRLGLEDGLLHSIDNIVDNFNIPKELAICIWERGIIRLKLIILKFLRDTDRDKIDKEEIRLLRIIKNSKKDDKDV